MRSWRHWHKKDSKAHNVFIISLVCPLNTLLTVVYPELQTLSTFDPGLSVVTETYKYKKWSNLKTFTPKKLQMVSRWVSTSYCDHRLEHNHLLWGFKKSLLLPYLIIFQGFGHKTLHCASYCKVYTILCDKNIRNVWSMMKCTLKVRQSFVMSQLHEKCNNFTP